eukprot:s405_g4.t1
MEDIDVNHMRAVEIILDSSADGSALPLEYAEVSTAKAPDGSLRFLDAQGSPLSISSTGVATVDFDGFSLKEEFIVASITSPLLSLGKLMKHGWSLQELDDGLHLVKDDKAIPVSFKRNSLCISGNIRMIEDTGRSHVRALQLRDSLQRVKTTWTKLSPESYAIKTYKAACVDVSLAPSLSMLWYRTTLVKRSGRWQVHQHNLFVSDEFATGSLEEPLPDPGTVQEVLTIGHTRECTHDQLGFAMIDEALDLLGPLHGSASSSFSQPPVVRHDDVGDAQQENAMEVIPQPVPDEAAPAPFEAPIAPDESPDADVVAGPEEITIDGVRIDSSSSLAALKAACDSLGVSVARTIIVKPTLPSTHSVVSFDFGYIDRGSDESLTVLFIHDRSTKMMHAVPAAAKGGRSLPFLTQELCRFVNWLGHQEVCLRIDNEPSTLSLLESCKKTLKGLGVHATVETIVPGNKEANGAAEITAQTIRNQANLLIEPVERSLGAEGRVLFGVLHPLYSWAVIHASWLHCRFAVFNGETAFERCTGREYHGKMCMFGEVCMGYLKPSAKGLASWQRGVTPALPPASVQPEQSKLQPYFDEEAEAVRGIPLTPIEKVPEDLSLGVLDPQVALPESAPPPPMMSPPSAALSTELDGLEEFDFDLAKDDADDAVQSDDALLQQLIFPYADQEPQLPAEQIAYLDAVAMELETTHLKQMCGLLPADTVAGQDPKRLSTRFVITWRDKVLNGQRCWLRRARYERVNTPGSLQTDKISLAPHPAM